MYELMKALHDQVRKVINDRLISKSTELVHVGPKLSDCRSLVVLDLVDDEVLMEHGLVTENDTLDLSILLLNTRQKEAESKAMQATGELDKHPVIRSLATELFRLNADISYMRAALGLDQRDQSVKVSVAEYNERDRTEKAVKAARYLKRKCHPDTTQDPYLKSLFLEVTRAEAEKDIDYLLTQEHEVREYLSNKGSPRKVRRSKLTSIVTTKRKRYKTMYESYRQYVEGSVGYAVYKTMKSGKSQEALELYASLYEFNLTQQRKAHDDLLQKMSSRPYEA